MNGNIPLVIGPEGPVPTPPTVIQQTIINLAEQESPGYTADLPGILIEDILSTDVPAISQIDQARVDAVNSISPYGSSPFILAQQGQMYGIEQNLTTNANVYVVFTGVAGYVIVPGFVVSDGTYQYVIQDGGAIASDGYSAPLYAVANQSGTWAIPANSVTTIVTSFPTGDITSVNNPNAGVPGQTNTESVQSYRSRVLQAGIVGGQGTAGYLKTLIYNVPGVTTRLVSVITTSNGWEVIVGGGDPYQVAGAIYLGVLDLFSIKGSATEDRNIIVDILDPPDTYPITFVNPPEQTVTVAVTWNTTLANFTAGTQVNTSAAPAIQNYINGIIVGQPINLLEMTAAFQNAVSSILDPNYLTTLIFTVSINDVVTPPTSGTSIIPSDIESYFYCAPSGVTVVQG